MATASSAYRPLAQMELTAAPEWAHGCDQCKHGIAEAPELPRRHGVALERLAQARLHMLTFCECQAGVMQEKYLRKLEMRLVNEALADEKLMHIGQRKSHPDIDAAMNAVVMFTPPPTMYQEEKRERDEQLYAAAHR